MNNQPSYQPSSQLLVARIEAHRHNIRLLEDWKTSRRLDTEQFIRACRTQLNLLGQIHGLNAADMRCHRQISAELAALEVPA